MGKIRDFFYNKNDIIIAIIIFCIAGVVIYLRIAAIMDYPKTIFQSQGSTTLSASAPSTYNGGIVWH